MNDDNTEGTPEVAAPHRKRTVALAAAVGVAGLVAGGVAAGGLSSASAESGGNGSGPGYGAPQGYGARPPAGEGKGPGMGPGRGCGDEKALTGEKKTKVLAAVKAKYPKATVQRVETDANGVYEAHITNGGKPLTVKLDKSFKITGTETGPPAGPGGRHGGPGGPPGGGPAGSGGEQRPPAPPSESGGTTA